MDKIAKFTPRLLHFLAYLSILAGFVGMLFIFYFLIRGTLQLIFVPQAIPAVAPVLPGIKVLPGLPVLSFWHWIISIFIVAVVHEFSHGVFARLHNINIKSSGFAFLGPILAAFVEPDEKELAKKTKKAQLAVFSAGPFSNVIMALIFIVIMNFIAMPIYNSVYEANGIKVGKTIEDYPAHEQNIQAPFIIKSINNLKTLDFNDFINSTKNLKPGDTIYLETDKGNYTLIASSNPENKSKAFIGITNFDPEVKLRNNIKEKYGEKLPKVYSWIHMLIFWLIIVNLGVGLFNLLPLGPIDGGRMFFTALLAIFKNAEKAKKIWSLISLFCLLLIFINLVPYLWKLLLFIIKPFILFFGI